MKYIAIATLAAALACTGCKSDSTPTADAGKDGQEIKDGSWVKVARGSGGGNFYVNKNSIWPYSDSIQHGDKKRDSGKIRAEVALQIDENKFQGTVIAFDCKQRLYSNLGVNILSNVNIPVLSWRVVSDIYNYACFGKVKPDFTNSPPLTDIAMDGTFLGTL